MKLPGNFDRFFKKKEKGQNLFLAILFEQARVTVAVFSSREVEAKILGFRQASYDGEIEDSVEVIDHLLAGLADEVPEVEDIEKTIFGFPKEFVDQDKIKPEILDKLKKIVKQLSLEPKGFVVLSEALAYYLSSKSGAQESAIFVGIFPSEVRISLLKIGKIIDEKTVARTDRICFDAEAALDSFEQEVLPAKIILYNSTHALESVKEDFLKYPWEKKSNFLHFPKIEILPAAAALEAVIGAYTDKDTVIFKEETAIAGIKDRKSETVEPEELGFSTEQVKEGEVDKTTSVEEKISPLSDRRRFLPKVRFGLPAMSLPRLPEKRWVMLFLIGLLMVGGGWWYITGYTASAELRILVNTRKFDQELEFTLDPEEQTVDIETRIIPGKKLSTKLTGEESKDTTGTTLIGEPAQGKVTIYNKTTKEKAFAKDTFLVAPNKLKFKLSEEVQVASASVKVEGGVETKTYGKKEANTQATEIGPEGNISKDTELVFEEYAQNEYSAQATEAFSGGTSREVSVVADDDARELRKQLLARLRSKAKEEIESEKETNLTVIEETIEDNIAEESLSTKVGEQAKKVTLKATVEFTALAFNSEDINALLQQNVESEIPSGFVMQAGKSRQTILERTVNKDGSVKFRSSFATTLIPDIKLEELRTKAVGMSIDEFEGYLRKQQNIGGVEFVFDNKLLSLLSRRLPQNADKITITIVPR